MTITRTELVRALVKGGDVILSTLDASKVHLLHMAVGVAGEASELLEATTPENLLEEIGDSRFYLEGLLQGLGETEDVFELMAKMGLAAPKYFTTTGVTPSLRAKLAVNIQAGQILDLVKKHVVYNQPLKRDELMAAMFWYMAALRALSGMEGITEEEIHAENLRKLGERYKGLTYSDAAAEAREDKVSA